MVMVILMVSDVDDDDAFAGADGNGDNRQQ